MRNSRTLGDVLVTFTDNLNSGMDMREEYASAFPEFREELMALMIVAARVKRALEMMRPSTAFRRMLKASLLEAAQQRSKPRVVISNPFRRQKIILLSAALGSALSVVLGIVAAVLVHNRSAQRSQQLPLS